MRAILAGTKTQTRRAVRPQPPNRPAVADCPLGQVGDVLYVREPWRAVTSHRYQYAADGPAQVKYRAAMYMPRAASRLSIQIDRVRAQRLHAITPADILAEGCEIAEGLSSRRAFAALWNRFYPPGVQWTDNPWVWVLHFHLITPS